MPRIMVPRFSTVEEPLSLRSLISVTLSPSASSAPLESLTLMSMVVPFLSRHPPKAGIQYAAASRLSHTLLWNTGPPAFAGDDSWWLSQLNLFRNLMRQADAANCQNHFGSQRFVALETAAGDGVAHCLLDLALRGDADFLEEAAQAGVEGVFVH